MPELTGPISGGCIAGGCIAGGPSVDALFGVSGGAVIHAGSAADGPRGAGAAKSIRSGFARLMNGTKPVEASQLGQAVTSRTR
jgi:hypothetical protein